MAARAHWFADEPAAAAASQPTLQPKGVL